MERQDKKIIKDVNKLNCSTDILGRSWSIIATDYNKYSSVFDVCSAIKALKES